MAITQSPTYPVAGEAVTVTSDATSVLVFDHAIELTSVPGSSSLSTGLQLIEGAPDGSSPLAAAEALQLADSFTPDVAGEYGVTIRVIQQLPQVGEVRYRIGAVESGTIQVGQVVELPIDAGSYGGATLRLTIVGTTIRVASLVDFADETSRAASLVTSVAAALTALVGIAASTAIGTFTNRVNDLLDNFVAHLADDTAHNVADTTNSPSDEAAFSTAGGIALLNRLRALAIEHALDAEAASRWHDAEDTENQPIVGEATTLGGATVLLADLRERFYERHRIQTDTPDTHPEADETNELTAPTRLDDVIVTYLDALVAASPTPAAGEVDGAVLAAAAGGFRVVA